MLKKETRYLIMANAVLEDGSIQNCSNKTPELDLENAKKTALKPFVNLKLQKLIITGVKQIWAEIPVMNPITGTKYEMQCIASISMKQDELLKEGKNG